jgi:3-oxoacyl-[acyl-carrier protein] reductase
MSPRTILITGCASGIGRHLAGALAARGHRILATDLDEEGLARAAAARGWNPARVTRRKLDVRREADWEGAIDAADHELGGLDVLLNVAGYLHPAYVAEIGVKEMDLTLDVNVRGVILGTRAAARRMVPRNSGHIINFGSLASLSPVPGLSVYAASKFAVRGFTLSAALELRVHGVAVTLVMPDAVDTPMLDKQIGHEEAALTFSGGRTLTVEDIEAALVDEVLPRRPLELTIPAARGVLARLATAAPAAMAGLVPLFVKLGRRKQEKIKHGRPT